MFLLRSHLCFILILGKRYNQLYDIVRYTLFRTHNNDVYNNTYQSPAPEALTGLPILCGG